MVYNYINKRGKEPISLEEAEKSRNQKVREIFAAYFFSMLFAFTGGYATLSLLQQQLDDKYHLISREKALELFALGQALPGVLSLNAGIMTGRYIAGWPGGIAAAAAIILPAFLGMLFISLSYKWVSGIRYVQGAIEGIRSASVALILTNAASIIGLAKRPFEWILVIFAFIATMFFGWNILFVILLCGVAGVARVAWQRKGAGTGCI